MSCKRCPFDSLARSAKKGRISLTARRSANLPLEERLARPKPTSHEKVTVCSSLLIFLLVFLPGDGIGTIASAAAGCGDACSQAFQLPARLLPWSNLLPSYCD